MCPESTAEAHWEDFLERETFALHRLQRKLRLELDPAEDQLFKEDGPPVAHLADQLVRLC